MKKNGHLAIQYKPMRIIPRSFARMWRRFRRRLVARLTWHRRLKEASTPDPGAGLVLNRKVRERATAAKEFDEEYALHRELDRAASWRDEHVSGGWFTRRYRDRF